MNNSLISALQSILALQRWNFLPRVETWVEAENAAYVTHLAYGIGKGMSLTPAQLECLVIRGLLKSLRKHFLTDINLGVRDNIRAKNAAAWTRLVDDAAKKTSGLFPRLIGDDCLKYLMDKPSYPIAGSKDVEKSRETLEDIVKYSQLRAAITECETNATIYKSHYKPILENLRKRQKDIRNHKRYEEVIKGHVEYFRMIWGLKYLRRWNRINRFISSSVLGHTYLVAILSIMFGWLSRSVAPQLSVYKSVLRALFHDVPESLTGDIITPVKDIISKEDPRLIEEVERELTETFLSSAPSGVQREIEEYGLMDELTNRTLFSVDSLVKDCDRVALVLECIYEKGSGVRTPEMESAYNMYHQELGKSEWPAIREFMAIVRNLWYEIA